MRKLLLWSVVTVACLGASLGCTIRTRADRERWRGYLSDDMINRPAEHVGAWITVSILETVGASLAGSGGYYYGGGNCCVSSGFSSGCSPR